MLCLVKSSIKRFWKEEKAQGMTEYAFILALVVLAVVGGLTVLGQGVVRLFDTLLNKEVFDAADRTTLPGLKAG